MIRRRLAAALSAVLFAQLSLVGASPQCRAGPGLQAGRDASPAATHAAHAPGAPASPAPDDAPRHQGVPGCASTSMCAVVMVAAPGEPVLAAETGPMSRIRGVATCWTSVTRVPDLPPPRA